MIYLFDHLLFFSMKKVSREETHGQDGKDLFSLEEKSGRIEEGLSEKNRTANWHDRQVLQIIDVDVDGAQRDGDLLIIHGAFGIQFDRHFKVAVQKS